MIKTFSDSDVSVHGCIPNAGKIYADSTDDLIYAPLEWQKRGLSQTSSGYGRKITSYYKINFKGKLYRLYNTCFGNASSTWFKTKGRTIFVD